MFFSPNSGKSLGAALLHFPSPGNIMPTDFPMPGKICGFGVGEAEWGFPNEFCEAWKNRGQKFTFKTWQGLGGS